MFQNGDYVVYGSTGVCEVKGIGKPDIPVFNESKSYYTLMPIYRTEVIYVPVDTTMFMRPIITREEASQLLETINQVEVPTNDTKKLNIHQFYESLLNSHQCHELLQLIKFIYIKNNITSEHRKLGGTDQRFLKTAEELLFTELSVALSISKDTVRVQVENQLMLQIA